MEKGCKIVTAKEIEAEKLDRFMRKCFSRRKSDFLRLFGEWRHRGDENRFVVLDEKSDCVGYFASIPVEIRLGDKVYPARWWMDLYVPPEHRGKGIQRATDLRAKRQGSLHFGFPNHLAAKIHRKHGWKVRDDLKVRMLPLKVNQIPHLDNLKGILGFFTKIEL